MTIPPTLPPQSSMPCSPEFSRQRVAVMLAKLWNHYPQEAKSPEAWKTLTEDFLAHLGRYPVAVIERAIERGQREWQYRPTIAHMVEQCDRAQKDMPRPERVPEGEDWKKNSIGGYTTARRADLARAWFQSNAALAEKIATKGHGSALVRAVEDGASIVAQTEFQRRADPSWSPARRYCENVAHDPVRGYQVDPNRERVARWLA